jgi:hypothetical protein
LTDGDDLRSGMQNLQMTGRRREKLTGIDRRNKGMRAAAMRDE